jgi:hypothetical protein
MWYGSHCVVGRRALCSHLRREDKASCFRLSAPLHLLSERSAVIESIGVQFYSHEIGIQFTGKKFGVERLMFLIGFDRDVTEPQPQYAARNINMPSKSKVTVGGDKSDRFQCFRF